MSLWVRGHVAILVGVCIHVNPERSVRGTKVGPPSEASQLRKGVRGTPRKLSKTYIANGAISVIPELYL